MNIAARDIAPAAYCTRSQHIELRLARADDAEVIAELFGAWFPTSIWRDCLTYDPAKAASYIAKGITMGVEPFILAHEDPFKKFSATEPRRNGVLVGCVSWHLDGRFTTKPIGVLDEVFVVPRLRRSDLGRRLVHLAMHIAKEEGAAVFNFPVCSGMPEQQSLINMLVNHIGAEPVGAILRKVL